MNRALACLLLIIGGFAGGAGPAAAEDPFLRGPDNRFWEPISDEVYLQETHRHIRTEAPVESVSVFNATVYAALPDGVYREVEGRLVRVPGAPGQPHRLRTLDDALWVMAESGLYRYDGNRWTHLDNRRFVDAAMHLGVVHAATRDDIFRYDDGRLVNIEPGNGYEDPGITFRLEDWSLHLPRPLSIGPVDRIASYGETVYVLRPGRLALFDGLEIHATVNDWGYLPSPNTRDLLAHNGRLYVATDRGVAVLRGMAMTVLDGPEGLPYEDTTCLAVGFDDDLWIGTTRGAIRLVDGEFQYFGAQRWLPHDHVNDIAVGERTVYAATGGGIGVIEYVPYTLRKKAAYYERHLEEWGHKRLGFTHLLHWSDEENAWVREITDNDAGYSSHYLVAMTFKYAATGDEAAREEAVNTFQSLCWTEDITPIPGFPARSIWAEGETGIRSMHASGGWLAQWHPTPDGLWQWKGDTSSDETNAHFYAVSLFHDLAAHGAEKERAKEHLRRIMDHIIDNGWVLRDIDGEPTRWGRWNPEYLQRPYGIYAQGLNGLEAQMYATATYALTGEQRFADGLQQLLDWRYHDINNLAVRQKHTFPPDYIVPWDDRLAFLSYYPLLKYTEDPRLRSIYMRSLMRSWEVKRFEKYPWYNFLYGVMTGNECEADVGVKHLREWPLDLINYPYRNSHRHDLFPEPGYTPYVQGDRAVSRKGLSIRETEPKKLDHNMLTLDGGTGRVILTPNSWLETYWMGRYYGLIEPPAVDDPELVSVEPRGEQFGAAPYDGPSRPGGIIPGR